MKNPLIGGVHSPAARCGVLFCVQHFQQGGKVNGAVKMKQFAIAAVQFGAVAGLYGGVGQLGNCRNQFVGLLGCDERAHRNFGVYGRINDFAIKEVPQRVVLLFGGDAAHLQRPNGRNLTYTGRTITNLLANLKHFQFLLFQSRSPVCKLYRTLKMRCRQQRATLNVRYYVSILTHFVKQM